MTTTSVAMNGRIGLIWSTAILATAATAMPSLDLEDTAKYLLKERVLHVRSYDQDSQMGRQVEVMSTTRSAPLRIIDPSSEIEVVGGITIEAQHADGDEFHNGLLADIVILNSLNAGWDGPDSIAPAPAVIADAIAVAQVWPEILGEPIVDVGPDGTISLDLLDDNGFLVAGVDLVGGKHRAVFSVMKGSKILKSGGFDASDQTEVIQAFDLMRATV